MAIKGVVLYEFIAMDGSSEISIYPKEIVTIYNKDFGEGWCEGLNSRGETGLFPKNYVDIIQEEPSTTTPNATKNPEVSAQFNLSTQSTFGTTPNPTASTSAPHTTTSLEPVRQVTEEPDWPDEDWEDEDDSGDNATDYGGPTGQRGFPIHGQPYNGAGIMASQTGAGFATSGGGPHEINSAIANMSIVDNRNQAPKSRKNFNRFSNFVKSGLESYVLESKSMEVRPEDFNHIQFDPELGIVWKPNTFIYTCAVTKHGKETKMKGLKTFISYDIQTSTSNKVVRRRYKHFDWLMQRLEEKYIVTPLPPLPEKQIAGRFQEDFVEHRRNLLQLWVNYITRHPVLSKCDVWWHFMNCSTDDMKGWKLGKRKAEKDELVGANFFHSVEVDQNTVPLDSVKTTKQLDNFQRFVSKFDEAVKHMFTTAVDHSKKFSTVYAKDYKKLSDSIKELSMAFQSGTAWRNSLGLNEAIRQTSTAYEEISKLYDEVPRNGFEPMADILHQYRGLLSGWPEILQLHKSTMNTKSEQERLLEEGKISDTAIMRVNERANVTTYATLAEINHFHNERLVDFKQMMQVFLTAQINFHTDILENLRTALNKIDIA